MGEEGNRQCGSYCKTGISEAQNLVRESILKDPNLYLPEVVGDLLRGHPCPQCV